MTGFFWPLCPIFTLLSSRAEPRCTCSSVLTTWFSVTSLYPFFPCTSPSLPAVWSSHPFSRFFWKAYETACMVLLFFLGCPGISLLLLLPSRMWRGRYLCGIPSEYSSSCWLIIHVKDTHFSLLRGAREPWGGQSSKEIQQKSEQMNCSFLSGDQTMWTFTFPSSVSSGE